MAILPLRNVRRPFHQSMVADYSYRLGFSALNVSKSATGQLGLVVAIIRNRLFNGALSHGFQLLQHGLCVQNESILGRRSLPTLLSAAGLNVLYHVRRYQPRLFLYVHHDYILSNKR